MRRSRAVRTGLDIQNRFIVYLCAKPGQLDDPQGLLKDVSSLGHHGLGDLKFNLRDEKDIPAVCEFVNQVINL